MEDAPNELERGGAPDARRRTGDDGDATNLERGVLGGIKGGENLCKKRKEKRKKKKGTGFVVRASGERGQGI